MQLDRFELAKLRGGDYAHAGETEAIDLVINEALKLDPAIKKGTALDLGCGLGGTAEYLRKKGFEKIWGVDIDEKALSHAKKSYPLVHFIRSDAQEIESLFDPHFFSFITLFNVLYAIEDKQKLLKTLASISQEGALLAIFDYVENEKVEIKDLAGVSMRPLKLSQMKVPPWQILKLIDLTESFIRWYAPLLKERAFKILSTLLKEKKWGGTLILARKSTDNAR